MSPGVPGGTEVGGGPVTKKPNVQGSRIPTERASVEYLGTWRGLVSSFERRNSFP